MAPRITAIGLLASLVLLGAVLEASSAKCQLPVQTQDKLPCNSTCCSKASQTCDDQAATSGGRIVDCFSSLDHAEQFCGSLEAITNTQELGKTLFFNGPTRLLLGKDSTKAYTFNSNGLTTGATWWFYKPSQNNTSCSKGHIFRVVIGRNARPQPLTVIVGWTSLPKGFFYPTLTIQTGDVIKFTQGKVTLASLNP